MSLLLPESSMLECSNSSPNVNEIFLKFSRMLCVMDSLWLSDHLKNTWKKSHRIWLAFGAKLCRCHENGLIFEGEIFGALAHRNCSFWHNKNCLCKILASSERRNRCHRAQSPIQNIKLLVKIRVLYTIVHFSCPQSIQVLELSEAFKF